MKKVADPPQGDRPWVGCVSEALRTRLLDNMGYAGALAEPRHYSSLQNSVFI
jgi:hypothetical protein